MDDFLMSIFSWVCGQAPEHTWAPAGKFLPTCQRCTGFYVGAATALILMLWFRPHINSRYRWLHAILVLVMTPFGFHLVPHGEIIRTLSGQWFGFGVVGLLWLLPGQKFFAEKGIAAPARRLHLGLGLTSLILLPVFAHWGGMPAAKILPWLALLGLVALAVMLTANVVIPFSWLFGSLIRKVERQAT